MEKSPKLTSRKLTVKDRFERQNLNTLNTRNTTSATDRLARIHRSLAAAARARGTTRDDARTSARVSRVIIRTDDVTDDDRTERRARSIARGVALLDDARDGAIGGGVPRPRLLRRDVSRRRARGTRANASEGDEEANSQELCRAEIPTHLPRADFVKQMYRWATSEFEEGGLSRYGKRMSVECVNEFEGGDTNGVMVRLYDFRDGKEVEIAQLIAKMDKEKVQVWDNYRADQGWGHRKDESGREGQVYRRTIFCRVETVAGGRIGEQCVEGYD